MSKQDFENEAAPERTAQQRALDWADDIRTRPLTDEDAIQLAGVYASIAAVEAQQRIAEAVETLAHMLEAAQQRTGTALDAITQGLETAQEALRGPVERLLAIATLSGIATAAETHVSEHETPHSETETP